MTDPGGDQGASSSGGPTPRADFPVDAPQPTALPSQSGAVRQSLVGARRDALIYFPASAVPALVSAVQTAVFTQVYTPAAWGVYALALSIVQLAVVTVSSWHDRATVRFVSAEDGRLDAMRVAAAPGGSALPRPALELANRLTWWNVGVFSAAGALGLLVIGVLWPDAIWLAAAGLVFGIGSLLNTGIGAIHRALLHSWVVVRSRLVASVAGFLLSLLAVFALGPLPSLLMLGPALGMVLAAGMLVRDLRRDRTPTGRSGAFEAAHYEEVSAPTPRTFLRYGVPLAGFYIAGWVLNLSDRFLLYGFADARDVGVYAPNYSIGALVVSLATIPLSAAMTSRILRLSDASSAAEIGRSVGGASRDFLLATVPVLIWTVLAKDQISAVLLGAEFREGSAVIPLVAAGTLTWALGQYVHKPLEMRNRTVTLLLLASLCSVFNVGLNLVLIPRLGYMGAAWSTFVAYSLYPLLAYVLTLSSVRWVIPWKTFGSLALVGAACLLLGNALLAALPSLHPVLMGASLATLVAVISLLVLFLTGETSPRRLTKAVRDVLSR